PIRFTVTFSEPVTGFTAADLSLAQSTVGGTLTAAVSGSGTTYSVTVDGMTTPGDVTLSFAAGAAADAGGNAPPAPAGGDPTVTYAGEIFAVGAANGGAPRVDVFNGTGRLLYSFFAFDGSFRGGVHVAVGDVTGDGIPDIVAGAGYGGAPHVKVFDGRTAAVVASFFAYDDSARGGVNVAVGDVTGDGRPDVITGAGPDGGPHVGVFDGTTLTNVKSFFAFADGFRGGVSVSAGDVNGDGRADIVTGNGSTGEIQVYDGITTASLRRIAPFFQPGETVLPLGVYTAVGDVTGDGIADVVTAAGEGGGPLVQVYDGSSGVLVLKNQVFAFDPTFRRGVTLAIRDMTGDGVGEILAGSGDNGDVKVLDGNTLATLSTLDPFGAAYVGGVFVG
ncbi:MAG TPA: FG-GAP-like repeat-containing protein, partial [Gemmataceae bacterium]|nr:FG-GAP-like repeat-containing protein [Gemmataceae bacterium]